MVGWEKAKLARKCLQAPCVLTSDGTLGIRARGQLGNAAVLCLSSPWVFWGPWTAVLLMGTAPGLPLPLAGAVP